MRKLARSVVAAAVLTSLAGTGLRADEAKTSARPTAESWFVELRKAAAGKDEKALAEALPATLVKGWPEEAKDDGRAWRAALAAKIAEGEVVRVREDGDAAVARWKVGAESVREMRFKFAGGKWTTTDPWAYCVGGTELSKRNGRGSAHVKLRARQTNESYGAGGFSFVHVTNDGKQCLNRVDAVYCRCGQVHLRHATLSVRKAAKLDEFDGLQTGGDWQDEIAPKAGAFYVLDLKEDDRKDFQVVLQVTACTANALEFDWRLVAAGKNAPESIATARPLPWKKDDADGIDGICAK